MWSKVLIFIFGAFICNASCDYVFPKPQVAFYDQGGFEVSIPADPKISIFAFHGRKNVFMQGPEPGTWNKDVTEATGGRFVFVEPDARFNLGDRLHFWLYVVYEGLGYELLYQMKEVKAFRVRPPGLAKTRYEFGQVRIHFLHPRGFEIGVRHEEGMSLMAFHGSINRPVSARSAGTWNKDITTVTDGYYTFRDMGTKFNVGDRLYFWLYVVYNGLGYHLEDQHYEFRGDEFINQGITFEDSGEEASTQANNNFSPRQEAPQSQGQNPNQDVECRKSISLVNGKRDFCAGAEIFFDSFGGYSLNADKWVVEKRIAGAPDYEFVYYSNHSISTGGNGLKIEPKLLTDVFGRRQLRRDLIVPDCTSQSDSVDCKYIRALTNDHPPPIVSSQISTNGKFSFLYGRVEILAKLPRGSWIFPQIWLQPQGFLYEKKDYKAGQIRIVTIDNNSGNQVTVEQGIILAPEEPLRSRFMTQRKLTDLKPNWDQEFHKFVLEWKPEGLVFWLDGERSDLSNWRSNAEALPGSDQWRNRDGPAPFDQEFYLTLGLGVGGRNDFSANSIPWDRTSPVQRKEFYRNKDEWYPTWTDATKSLEVKHVKIFAL